MTATLNPIVCKYCRNMMKVRDVSGSQLHGQHPTQVRYCPHCDKLDEMPVRAEGNAPGAPGSASGTGGNGDSSGAES